MTGRTAFRAFAAVLKQTGMRKSELALQSGETFSPRHASRANPHIFDTSTRSATCSARWRLLHPHPAPQQGGYHWWPTVFSHML